MICTATEVFDYISYPQDLRAEKTAMITALIPRVTAELEALTQRSFERRYFKSEPLIAGRNCTIDGSTIYLLGMMRDLHAVVSLTEGGSAITAAPTYSQDGYYLDGRAGILTRSGWGQWATTPGYYQITGYVGICDWATSYSLDSNWVVELDGDGVEISSAPTYEPRGDAKQCAIELTAARSGLWTWEIQTVNGPQTMARDSIPQETKNLIERLRNGF